MDISVIIPTYNRMDMLRRAVTSVLTQENCGKIEVIVVDDGSSDGTCEMVARDYPQVKLLKQAHKGAPAARNLGMSRASGDCIALLDDDDELLPESLAVRMKALVQNPEIDLVCADYLNCAPGSPEGESYFEHIQLWSFVETTQLSAGVFFCHDFFDAQLRLPIASTISLILRRHAIKDDEYFDEDLIRGQDWEFVLRFSQNHSVGLLGSPVALRHCHDGNMVRPQERRLLNQILLDRKVLGWTRLTEDQRQFCKERLGNDLFEAAYYFSRQSGKKATALRYWMASARYGVGRRTLKLLVRCLLPWERL